MVPRGERQKIIICHRVLFECSLIMSAGMNTVVNSTRSNAIYMPLHMLMHYGDKTAGANFTGDAH